MNNQLKSVNITSMVSDFYFLSVTSHSTIDISRNVLFVMGAHFKQDYFHFKQEQWVFIKGVNFKQELLMGIRFKEEVCMCVLFKQNVWVFFFLKYETCKRFKMGVYNGDSF